MPHAHKLQGWITIRGPDRGTIIQDEDEWLDLEEYDDVVVWWQVTDASNVEALHIQTSPVREEGTFVNMVGLSLSVTEFPVTTTLTFAGAGTPLARYLRWKCMGQSGSSFSLTFRAWIVASGRFTELSAFPSGAAEEPPPAEQEEEDIPEQEEDERAWKAWRPPVLLAGPSTLSLPEFRRLTTRIPEGRAMREGEPMREPEAGAGRGTHEGEAPARGRP